MFELIKAVLITISHSWSVMIQTTVMIQTMSHSWSVMTQNIINFQSFGRTANTIMGIVDKSESFDILNILVAVCQKQK